MLREGEGALVVIRCASGESLLEGIDFLEGLLMYV